MEKKEWIFNMVEEFRRQIKNEHSQYAEFFHVFSDKVPYVSLSLWNVEYDNVLKEFELRVYKTSFRDRFDGDNILHYKTTSGVPTEEGLFIEHENHQYWEGTLWEEVDYDETIQQSIMGILYPEEIIMLPLDFLKNNIKEFVKRVIESTILNKLKNLQNQVILNKSLNRLSLLNQGEITNIRSFLDNDWTKLNDKIKTKMLVKIFSSLGFETIPIELLLHNPKYSEFNNKAHPEMIIYDINSNNIVLIEELTKLVRESLFKLDITRSVIKKFNSFFPKSNRKISYLIIVNKPITIDLDHYNFKERVILKEDLSDKLKEIFNPNFLQKNLFNFSNEGKIEKIIDFFKNK